MKKYYVVFDGKVPGIYETWDECKKQTYKVKGAKFKSYESYEEAKEEFERFRHQDSVSKEDVAKSISTDASFSGKTSLMEYRIVETKTGKELYRSKVFPQGTNNIGEFLGLVKSMKLLKKAGEKDRIIFTDSATAIAWVKRKEIKTSLKREESTELIFREVERAIEWLKNINVNDFKIVKWETHIHGENKADFGRKS